MRAVLKTLALLVFLPLPALAFNVIVDPGHGGYDRGAVKKQDHEAVVNLQVAKLVAAKLRAHPGISVKMTRSNDTAISLKNRALKANRLKGDLLVSIHANSSPDPRAKGAEFYFQNQWEKEDEAMLMAHLEQHHSQGEGKERLRFGPKHANAYVKSILEDLIRQKSMHQSSELAKSFVNEWQGYKKSKKYVIQQAPFYVISNVAMPSVLVELGFMTHKKEGRLLQSKAYQRKLATSIYQGIVKYKESLDKSQ